MTHCGPFQAFSVIPRNFSFHFTKPFLKSVCISYSALFPHCFIVLFSFPDLLFGFGGFFVGFFLAFFKSSNQAYIVYSY